MPIQFLSPQLANQIAAGEVVERPASVVKELLENSLDAGADRIEIDIEKGGHKRIRIFDNGKGIPKDELQLALSRHATSKIATLDDLEHILSLGFRGEALASISSVSRLTLTSRTANQNEAWQACCEGREMAVTVQPAAHPQGTTIDVADLFYNTPARRKFLRTEKTEFQHIEEVIKRIALSYPHASFLLKHNGKLVKRFIADKQGALAPRIASVLGQKFVDNAVHINVDYEGIQMDAWLGNESVLRSSNDCQFSFVNGRGMRDKLIMHAIRQAYESVWGVLEQPSFVVYLTLDPRDVDVNVHPAKHEVRFQQGRLVHDFICKSVCDALHAISQPESHEETVTESSTRADTISQSPAPFQHEPANHEYIRPLAAAPQSPKVGGQSAPFTPRQSKGPSAAYQAGFQSLMSPNSDMQTKDSGSQPNHVQYLGLSSLCRIYSHNERIYLLDVVNIVGYWLTELCSKAQHSQPLLMPVALAMPMDSAGDEADNRAENIALLNGLHFEINQVAGKYRLQQVPAGTRHLPWLRWFEKLLSAKLFSHANTKDSEEGSQKQTVLFDFSVAENELDDNTAHQVWHWLEQQNDLKQWEMIERFGTVRDVTQVVNFLRGTNG
ncbi:DNA mismatch repair endonuclease MutL [Alteromonas sp. 345S023]|uniref:DNA mismatch repair protein MutL n=1 Tax=Alteromonas profundi TaxID=2696062 RepID=A0A7X5LP40_9ALTE|nr:DNA mismatch repair endonuclease MutL [Alteromonas profundi]NDV92951.1 DNA mismatch repair endonuclease MutL [Alteromonas profundi]